MEFGVLGPVRVSDGGRTLPPGSARERFVLATLLLHEGRLVPANRLVEDLWERPPVSARPQLHNAIRNLRGRIGPGVIVTRPLGYELQLGDHALDLAQFRDVVTRARTAAGRGEHALAADELGAALTLWRGPALADVDHSLAEPVRRALHEERLSAAESWLDALLAIGRHEDVLRALPALLTEHPRRDHLHRVHVLALMAAGRRTGSYQRA